VAPLSFFDPFFIRLSGGSRRDLARCMTPSLPVDQHTTAPSVTVLAPAYNEEQVIESFVVNVARVLQPGWELLIVDDGSTDRTGELLRGVGPTPGLRVVTHARNQGMGAALRTGFSNATGDIVITVDADLSHPLELIPALVSAASTSDVVFASRYVRGGGMLDVPWHRAAISRVANAVLRRLLRIPVRDLTTGFRAYRRSALTGIRLEGTGFETQLELTVKLARSTATMTEVPMLLRKRMAGTSKMRYTRLAGGYGRMVLRLMLRR